MLISEAELATRFMYDYHFYHDVSSNFTQSIRAELVRDLELKKPRFVVEVWESPKPSGSGTDLEFAALRNLIANDYEEVRSGEGYKIYEHRLSSR